LGFILFLLPVGGPCFSTKILAEQPNSSFLGRRRSFLPGYSPFGGNSGLPPTVGPSGRRVQGTFGKSQEANEEENTENKVKRETKNQMKSLDQ
jgi:hypothetical protein